MSKHYPLPPDFWPGKPKRGLSVHLRVRPDATPQARALAMTAAMRKLSRLVTEEGLFNELRERQHFKSRTALRREREHAARRREQTRLMRQDRDLFGESPRGKTDAKKRPTTRTQASSQTELE